MWCFEEAGCQLSEGGLKVVVTETPVMTGRGEVGMAAMSSWTERAGAYQCRQKRGGARPGKGAKVTV